MSTDITLCPAATNCRFNSAPIPVAPPVIAYVRIVDFPT
jgi:hypothetical protein